MPANATLDDPQQLVSGLLLLLATGIAMVLVALLAGGLIRRARAHPVKLEAYECGEPPAGQGWVQFDLRFYVAALVFLVFDVEIALLYPWAVVYGEAGVAALWDMLFFFGILVLGFLFLWRFGYLDWVRASSGQPATGLFDRPMLAGAALRMEQSEPLRVPGDGALEPSAQTAAPATVPATAGQER